MNTFYRNTRTSSSRIAGAIAAVVVTFGLLQSVTSLFQSAPELAMARATSVSATVVATAR